MSIKLSILICSLNKRAELLAKLRDCLETQKNDAIEILINRDSGIKTIGRKRNELLQQAQGEYIAFIDDDDLVSEDYVSKILNAIEHNPDCCGIEGIVTFNGQNPKKFIQSLKYNRWFEEDNIYYRCPNHLSPIKRELALKVGFEDISFQEDRVYSARIYPLLKSEHYIEGAIYFYKFVKGKPDQRLKLRTVRGVDIEPKIRTWGVF